MTKLILSLSERNSKVTSQKHKHLEWEEFVATFQSAIATNEPRKMFTLNFLNKLHLLGGVVGSLRLNVFIAFALFVYSVSPGFQNAAMNYQQKRKICTM